MDDTSYSPEMTDDLEQGADADSWSNGVDSASQLQTIHPGGAIATLELEMATNLPPGAAPRLDAVRIRFYRVVAGVRSAGAR